MSSLPPRPKKRVRSGSPPNSNPLSALGDAIAFADSTCGFIRQSARSSPAQVSVAKSNAHRAGFSITPSFTPSAASQAFSTASWIIGYLLGGMTAAGSRFMKTFKATRAA
jgi:hypothetical protein